MFTSLQWVVVADPALQKQLFDLERAGAVEKPGLPRLWKSIKVWLRTLLLARVLLYTATVHASACSEPAPLCARHHACMQGKPEHSVVSELTTHPMWCGWQSLCSMCCM